MYSSSKVGFFFAAFLLVLVQACTSTKPVNSENIEAKEVVEAQVSITFVSEDDEARLVETMPNYGLRRKARSSRSQPIYIYFYNANAVSGEVLVAELKASGIVTNASLLQ